MSLCGRGRLSRTGPDEHEEGRPAVEQGQTLRLKFQCDSITSLPGNIEEAHLSPVWLDKGDTDGENIWADIPRGMIHITVTNPVATGEYFKPGESYFLDFSLAETAEQNAQMMRAVKGQPVTGAIEQTLKTGTNLGAR